MIMNASQMIADVRSSLNESTANFWTDLEILRKINKAQAMVYSIVSQQAGDWLLKKSSALTASNSLITLPSDCAKPVYLEDATHGTEIPFSITVRERRLTRIVGTNLDILEPDAYMLGDYIEVNQDSFGGSAYLWYERRVPDLHAGTGGSGSTTNTLVFQSTNIPVPRDDYYNSIYVSITGGTGVGTRAAISDYTGSTYTATVAGSFGTDSVYGTETILPEESIPLITQTAVMELIAKPSAAVDPKYFEYALAIVKSTKSDFIDWISTRVKNSVRIRPQEDWL
jgi:hypothetical protein